jgi:16S rRNA (adenine1518-N6/adenine1519-N6)-dimethyltransferase
LSLPPLDVPQLIHQFGIHPSKSLGQNFLLDESALDQVVSAAEISPVDVVLEIGPGLGSLTRHLALAAQKVIAVELDSRLIPALRQVVGQYANIQVVEGDIMALDPARLISGSSYLVVANIPYYITSALIRHLLESISPPRRFVLTIQKEVAERICASPGKMSLLSLSVQIYGHPQIVAYVPAEAFYPAPNVDSAVIRQDLYAAPMIPVSLLDSFFTLTRAGFSQKRKTLRNALSAGLHRSPPEIEQILAAAHIDPMRRAETLSIPEWHQLTEVYYNGNFTDS